MFPLLTPARIDETVLVVAVEPPVDVLDVAVLVGIEDVGLASPWVARVLCTPQGEETPSMTAQQMGLWLFPVCAVGIGCGSVKSADLQTAGMYITAEVETDDWETHLSARITTGPEWGADRVELGSGDRLSASYGDVLVDLVEDNAGYHRATTQDVVGDEVVFHLDRSSDVSAPSTIVTMPPLFEITAPTAGEVVDVEGSLVVEWSPPDPGEEVSYVFTQSGCVPNEEAGFDVEDDGYLLLDLGEVEVEPSVTSDQCEATLEMTRQREGVVDPAFEEGGEAVGRVIRTIGFTTQYPAR